MSRSYILLKLYFEKYPKTSLPYVKKATVNVKDSSDIHYQRSKSFPTESG